MGLVEELRRAGETPFRDGLYRPDDTGRELHVEGPGAYHPDAGQPIPFRLGGPLDVARALDEYGAEEVDTNFESPLPDGSRAARPSSWTAPSDEARGRAARPGRAVGGGRRGLRPTAGGRRWAGRWTQAFGA
ncbi:hypothetical protein ACWEQL_29320 [Kitasatospora sp. NPDC004240]